VVRSDRKVCGSAAAISIPRTLHHGGPGRLHGGGLSLVGCPNETGVKRIERWMRGAATATKARHHLGRKSARSGARNANESAQ